MTTSKVRFAQKLLLNSHSHVTGKKASADFFSVLVFPGLSPVTGFNWGQLTEAEMGDVIRVTDTETIPAGYTFKVTQIQGFCDGNIVYTTEHSFNATPPKK